MIQVAIQDIDWLPGVPIKVNTLLHKTPKVKEWIRNISPLLQKYMNTNLDELLSPSIILTLAFALETRPIIKPERFISFGFEGENPAIREFITSPGALNVLAELANISIKEVETLLKPLYKKR